MDSFADHPDVPVGKETSGYEVSWDGLRGANPLYKNFSLHDRTVHVHCITNPLESSCSFFGSCWKSLTLC